MRAPHTLQPEIPSSRSTTNASSSPGPRPRRRVARSRLALAPFDEYFLGYADRSAVCDPRFAQRVVPGSNGVFQPILVANGRVEGVWKAKQAGGGASVALDPFEPPIDAAGYASALKKWARFRGVALDATAVVAG